MKHCFCKRHELGLKKENHCQAPSCYSSIDNQGQTAPTLIIKHFILSQWSFPQGLVSFFVRKYSAVNTLYIFMFWEVLLDLCVNRVTCARDTFCQWKGTFIRFPAFILLNAESISLADKMWLSEACVCIYLTTVIERRKWIFLMILLMKLMQLIVHYDGIHYIQLSNEKPLLAVFVHLFF